MPINCLFLFSFFKTSYGHFCLFSDRYFGNISRTKATIKNAGFQFVDWCMMNIVSENHTQIRKIERGMANLPLWQWLGPARRVNLTIITLQPLFGGETYLAGISVPCTAVYHLWHLNLFGWWLNVEFQFWGVLIGYKSWAVQTKTYRHFRTCQDRHVARPYNTYR